MTDTHSPVYAVLAVAMHDQSTGTVVSLHTTHDMAKSARKGYRFYGPGLQPDLYVVGAVPQGTMVGAQVPLTGGGVAPDAEEERTQEP